MEHRLQKKHLQLKSDTDASNETYLKEKEENKNKGKNHEKKKNMTNIKEDRAKSLKISMFFASDATSSTISVVCCHIRKQIDEHIDDFFFFFQRTTRQNQKCEFFRTKPQQQKIAFWVPLSSKEKCLIFVGRKTHILPMHIDEHFFAKVSLSNNKFSFGRITIQQEQEQEQDQEEEGDGEEGEDLEEQQQQQEKQEQHKPFSQEFPCVRHFRTQL